MLESLIIIGGGVGPMAGVKAAEQLVKNTNANTDQTHPEWHLVNTTVSDRTQYLLDEKYRHNNISPAIKMAHSVRTSIVGAWQQTIVTGVPCNTFHAFSEEYEAELGKIAQEAGKNIVFVNMIDETVKMIQELIPEAQTIGVISIVGMRRMQIYDRILAKMGVQIVQISDTQQEEFNDTIYNPNWGIKSSNHDKTKTTKNLQKYADNLKSQGARALILGCTEIPLVLTGENYRGMPLIDPVTALVRGLLRDATNGEKLKPLNRYKYLTEE